MASFTERVTILIETKVTSAKSELAGLKKAIAETEGATGKLKVAAGGMGKAVNSAVSALASPTGIAAAGAAITGVAVKSVKAFEQLGLTVGKFSDATGIATEDASKLVEVVSDLGIAPEQAQQAIGKMSKAIGANSDAFAQYGINAVKAADGTVDVMATFQNAISVISQIRDPTQQAAAANAVFGKSWQSMAELIKGGAPALQSALASVQKSKVLDDSDVKSARDVRDAFDAISDAADGMFLTIGKALAPAIADLATKLADVTAKAEPMAKAFGDAVSQMVGDIGPLIDGLVAVGEEISKIGASDIAPGVGVQISDAWGAFLDALPAVGDVRHFHDLMDAIGGGTVKLTGEIGDMAFAQGNATEKTKDAADAAAELAKKQKEANEAFAASGKALTDWATRTVKAFEDAQTAFVDLADAQGQIDDMSSTFAGMERAASAMQSAFDLGNAPIDTLGRIQDIDGAIRDLGQFIKDNKGVVPNIFNPNDIQAGPFLAKIDSLRTPVQRAITDAFATGGPAAAQATADSYVTQIVKSLHGKITPGDVQALLGLTDLQATIKVAVDEKSKAEAESLLETLTGLQGQTPWTAQIKLELEAGTLSADAAKILEAQRLKELGLDVPANLLPPTGKDFAAAKAQADRFKAQYPIDMAASVDAPDVRAVLLARRSGQDIADNNPIVFPSTVAVPTASGGGGIRRFDAGGTVGGYGGIAGERGPEIINRRYLTTGPTFVPPGTQVTSRRRTAVILRTRGTGGLRRYDGGGTVPMGPVTVNFNGVGQVGNRYDLDRQLRKSLNRIERIYGTRG